MNYSELWKEFEEIKGTREAFSSHSQIRKALLRYDRSQNIQMIMYDDFRIKTENGTVVNSLPELILLKPRVPEIICRRRYISIYRSTSGEINITRKISANYKGRDRDGLGKKLGTDGFEYLWEVINKGTDNLLRDLRLLTPCVIKRTIGDANDTEEISKVLKKAGMKLVEIPDDIPEYDLLDNPFIFGERQLLFTDDTKRYLEALKKHRESKKYETKSITKLLDLWK